MKNAKEILDFYILSGITEVVADTPFGIKTPPKNGAQQAKQIALSSNDLQTLLNNIKTFDGCNLKQTSNHTITGKGNNNASYMILIDAPSDDDERSGNIFSGKSKEFIKNFLKAINIDEQDCFFSTLLPWRPPGNRAPTSTETEICWPFLEKQISLINPKKIFAFGQDSSQLLANNKKTITQLREKKLIYESLSGQDIEVIPSLSINYLLFNPSQKAKLWDYLIKCD